jgi:SSS family solute:Na+ symporter
MLIVAIVVIAYTIVGGQLSVIKTDALQFIIIGTAFIATFVYLFFFSKGDTAVVFSNIEFLNDRYGVKDLIIQLFIVGGTYLLGPDVISRNLVAKDGRTAKRSAIVAAVTLVFFALMVVLIGMFIIGNYDDLGDVNPLIYIIRNILPKPVAVLLAIGLLSTLLSSADTCLVNISSIIENDVFRKNRVWALRLWAGLIGLIAVIIAFFKGDIISMLTGAYSVYAPGIVFPLFVAIMTHKKKRLNVPLWVSACLIGGICGALNTYVLTSLTYLPISGMAISLVLAVLSYVFGDKVE